MENVKPKIIEMFEGIDFVKHICYENDTRGDEITLIVIYEHDNSIKSRDIIFKQFFKLEDIFPDIYMEVRILHTTEVGPYRLNDTTTVFKRE